MPRKTKRRRSSSSRRRVRAKRTYRRTRYSPRFSRLSFGIPKTKVVKLRHKQFIELNPLNPGRDATGSGGTNPANDYGQVYHRFVANGCWQPDYDAGGVHGQPMYFDQWALLYSHYVVTGARITVEACSTSGSAGLPGYLAVHLNNDQLLDKDWVGPELLQQPFTRSTVLQANATTSRRTKVSMNFSAKKWFDVKDLKDNIKRLGAQVTTNPSDNAIFFVVAGALNNTAGTDLPRYDMIVTIDYIVRFSERKDVEVSTSAT